MQRYAAFIDPTSKVVFYIAFMIFYGYYIMLVHFQQRIQPRPCCPELLVQDYILFHLISIVISCWLILWWISSFGLGWYKIRSRISIQFKLIAGLCGSTFFFSFFLLLLFFLACIFLTEYSSFFFYFSFQNSYFTIFSVR